MMQGFAGTQVLTADTDVTSGQPTRVFAIHIISAGTAGVVNLRNGTLVTDTIRIQHTGLVNTGATFTFGEHGFLFPDGLFYDEDANVTSTAIVLATEV